MRPEARLFTNYIEQQSLQRERERKDKNTKLQITNHHDKRGLRLQITTNYADLLFVIFLHKCTFWAQFFSTWKRVNCGKISQNFSIWQFFSTNMICDICDKYELWNIDKVTNEKTMKYSIYDNLAWRVNYFQFTFCWSYLFIFFIQWSSSTFSQKRLDLCCNYAAYKLRRPEIWFDFIF